jgi:hypothetical protein
VDLKMMERLVAAQGRRRARTDQATGEPPMDMSTRNMSPLNMSMSGCGD